MSEKPHYIYTLSDPFTSEVRYVGVTMYPELRYSQHVTRSKDNTHKSNWIKRLQRNHAEPTMEILTLVHDKDVAMKLEMKYIQEFKELGANLTNLTLGGESPMANKKHTEETKRKMSEVHSKEKNHFYGKTHSAETRKLLSEKLTGRKSWNAGKKLTDAHRMALCKTKSTSAYNKGLTRFDLELMEKMLQEGTSQRKVAEHFGTHQGTISKYKRKHKFNLNANA